MNETASGWTCSYCRVETRWMGRQVNHRLPANWTQERRGPACLACRRELAADAAITGDAFVGLPLRERARLRTCALVEFEIARDPERSNAQIASALHTSVVSVQKARDRLGLASFTA